MMDRLHQLRLVFLYHHEFLLLDHQLLQLHPYILLSLLRLDTRLNLDTRLLLLHLDIQLILLRLDSQSSLKIQGFLERQ
jgi:hypothetical protein